MATIKKTSKAKNISAGPSKKTPVAGPVDPKGQFTKVQKRTLGSMKTGGKIKKANYGDKLLPGQKPSKNKPVNNYDNGPIFGGNKELPKNKKEFSELRKKQNSENTTIQKSLKSTFDNMKKGGKTKKK